LDSTGQKAASTYTPTVVVPPVAKPDETVGKQGEPQVINLLTNPDGTDLAATDGATLDPTTVKLCGLEEISPNCTQTTVDVPGVGTYSVSSSGVMTFVPDPDFTGAASPLAYTVLDTKNRKVASTYTASVAALPTAKPDTTKGAQGEPQSINVITNGDGTGDAAGTGATLVPSSVRLCAPVTPAIASRPLTSSNRVRSSSTECPIGPGGSVVIPGEGTYTVSSSGVITFTPLPDFTGTATPITYSVTDSLGQTVTSTYTPTITPDAPPVTPEPTPEGSGTSLPRTGADNLLGIGLAGLLLVLLGIVLIRPRRRGLH
jgi:LPXTG-motif cell wall-anchored protein